MVGAGIHDGDIVVVHYQKEVARGEIGLVFIDGEATAKRILPEKDSYHETKAQPLAQMDVAMGGRAAEELIFGKEKITGT